MSAPEMNKTCGEMREMFSPMLDGELAGGDGARLTEHLRACEACRKEFDLWRRISETLKSEAISGEPSPDFCAGVMRRIGNEAGANPKRGLIGAWRAPAAAAAAAVMLFAGSWGVSVALRPGNPPAAIVENTGQTGNVAKEGQETATPPAAQTGDAGKTVSPGTPAGEPENTNEVAAGTPAYPPKAGEPLKNTVLLSNAYREISSTILKLSVANIEDAKNVALALAAGKGGGGQVLTSQKKGAGELVILRITVPREEGKSLAAQLSGLGGIIDRIDERKNISDNYNQAVNRLNDIRAGTGQEMAAEEKSRLEAEASVLKRQIDSWDEEAGSYVIILWLEH